MQEYFNQVGLDLNLYYNIEYQIENSDTIILAGYIDTPINVVFDKVKTIIVLNCNYEFLIKGEYSYDISIQFCCIIFEGGAG